MASVPYAHHCATRAGDRICNRVISDIVLRETTLTITDSVETGSPLTTHHRNSKSGFPLYKRNNRDNTLLNNRSSGSEYLKCILNAVYFWQIL